MKRAAECHPGRVYAAKGLCRSCYVMRHRRAQLRALSAAERRAHYKRVWARRNKEKVAEQHRRGNWRRLYGLSAEQVVLLLREQGGSCAVCSVTGKLEVDHDHTTGEVRGLVCRRCNLILGCIEKATSAHWRYLGGERVVRRAGLIVFAPGRKKL